MTYSFKTYYHVDGFHESLGSFVVCGVVAVHDCNSLGIHLTVGCILRLTYTCILERKTLRVDKKSFKMNISIAR